MNLCPSCDILRPTRFSGRCDHCGTGTPANFRSKVDDLAGEILSEAECLYSAQPEDLEHSIACISALVRKLETLAEPMRPEVDA